MFIGIVVAAMLKNTGSQAAVSRGYGANLVMNSTVSSGIVATESYMQSENEDFMEKALEAIQKIVNYNNATEAEKDPADRHPYVLGSTKDGRRELVAGTGQFFSSKLLSFDEDSKHAVFEIESGKNAKGKALKKARAFYLMDGLEIIGGEPFGGNSALFLGGQMIGGQANMHVNGYATFMKSVQINASTSSLVFEPDAEGHGNVFFNDFVFTEVKDLQFQVPAFFNDDAKITGYASNTNVFQQNVGFNKNISTANYAASLNIAANKNMWVNKGFQTRGDGGAYANNTTKIGGSGSLFYNAANITNSACAAATISPCALHGLLSYQHSPAATSTAAQTPQSPPIAAAPPPSARASAPRLIQNRKKPAGRRGSPYGMEAVMKKELFWQYEPNTGEFVQHEGERWLWGGRVHIPQYVVVYGYNKFFRKKVVLIA